MWVIFVTLFLSYGYFVSDSGWNGWSRMDLVRALVEDRTTRIDRFHENTEDKSFFNGHYYSDKAPGASFLAAPVYGVYFGWLKATLGEARARTTVHEAPNWRLYLSTLAASAFPSAVEAALFFIVAAELVQNRNKALFVTAAYGLGSLAFPYSTVLFGTQLSGALLFISFGLLVRERRRAQSLELPWRRWPVMLSGLAAAYAVLSEYTAAVPLLIICLYLVWVASDRRLIAAFVSGALPPVIFLVAYNWGTFGSPIGIGYSHLVLPEFVREMGEGFLGLTYPKPRVLFESLFGFYRGLLPLCPILALSTVGFRQMWALRSLRPEFAVCVGIVSFYLLFNMSFGPWDGGDSLGPRYLVPMLSFLALPMVFGLSGAALPPLLLLTSIGSIGGMLAGAAFSPIVPSSYVNVPFDYLYPGLLTGRGYIQWNWGVALGFHSRSSLLPLLTLWLTAAVLLIWRGSPSGEGRNLGFGTASSSA